MMHQSLAVTWLIVATAVAAVGAGGAVGYPDRSADLDVWPGFQTPPKGYGGVPFYWWNGDELTRERLAWQLDVLGEAGVQGFAVSYIHSHPQADVELNKGGHGAFGRTMPGKPPIFSKAWWAIWRWFSAECGKRGIGLGLDDYTMNWPGNGYWPDKIRALPKMKNYRGRLRLDRPVTVKGGQTFDRAVDEGSLAVMAYPAAGRGLDVKAAVDLLPLAKDGRVRWRAPRGKDWQVVSMTTTTDNAYMLHPDHGKELVRHYFQRFEDRMDAAGRKGMNFFFQDELGIPLGLWTWAEDFREQFRKRKGYDIVPSLPALGRDIGPVTPKVRLDYYDVLMDLAEERYFKPVFDWHSRRGLLYGCDNNGRGRAPTAYVDYFRATRWFTAPGNDAPGRGQSFIQTKVSASIAHLYDRPRVWLEAFHSMGWATRPDWLTEQLDRHYLFGGNLLCLHGLYYTLHGGWWEWAPPCFHFRMPYWPHMKIWLKYAERLSYLLSQGRHVCDVAIVYPVSPMQAVRGHGPGGAFAVAGALHNAGIDFDFIDYQSLARAKVEGGRLNVAGESYRALVLADLPAVRFTTLQKARQLARAGGTVLATGKLPAASDRAGADDPELDAIVKELFGAKPAAATKPPPAASAPKPRKYPGGFEGRWVWSAEPRTEVYFKAVWPAAAGTFGVRVHGDNILTLFVNDAQRAASQSWAQGWTGKLKLKPGDVITIDVRDTDAGRKTAGMFFAAVHGGRTVLSAEDFRYSLDTPSAAWRTSRKLTGLKRPDLENVHETHRTGQPPGGGTAPASGGIARKVAKSIVRDFVAVGGKGRALHRRAGRRDVYMVMDAPKGTECFFRCKGRAELWDAWTGSRRPLPITRTDDNGTHLRIPLAPPRACLIVFSPGEPVLAAKPTDTRKAAEPRAIALDGLWECELTPTMDNRWGDFRLPARQEIIGAEARQFRCTAGSAPKNWTQPDFDDSKWPVATYSFGPKMWQLRAPAGADFDALVGQGKQAGAWRPYEFSWRWGVRNQPGSQGYHGLKGKVRDEFLILDGGGHFVFRTAVSVAEDTETELIVSGRKPDRLLLDGKAVRAGGVKLTAGSHQLLIAYRGVPAVRLRGGSHHIDTRPRSAVVLVRKGVGPGRRRPLAMRWFGLPGLIPFDDGRATDWQYRFRAPPGLREMRLAVRGSVKVWVNGTETRVRPAGEGRYRVQIDKPAEQMSTVAVRVSPDAGCDGGAAFPEPIRLTCGTGRIALGDWSRMGVLKHYSGGMWYRRGFELKPPRAGDRVMLDLGQVVATCEVRVNGQPAGVLVNSPFAMDVTQHVRGGANRVEVLVYNTLSNHYQTTPSPYKSAPTSGLLGPVRVVVSPGE